MNRTPILRLVLATVLAFMFTSISASAQQGGVAWQLDEGQSQEIVTNAGTAGYVKVTNTGDGNVVVVVHDDNDDPVKTTIAPGHTADVWFQVDADVTLVDKKDDEDYGSEGTWQSIYPT